ncbi:hypothetical protein FB45DRAFT_1116768 [Roridomyces roridus]|uniref:Uncharacterized protein n=1 Tax=Roridomyces roridus TaxID=1738132 RepID=A0AAD7CCR6_9AGAR|nr:hypothetical protein FB45DRAFT_1116768 [Roridomyces roridus]
MDGDSRQLFERGLEQLQKETEGYRARAEAQTREIAEVKGVSTAEIPTPVRRTLAESEREREKLHEELRASQAKIAEKKEELIKEKLKREQREQELKNLRASGETMRAELGRFLDGLGGTTEAGTSPGQRKTGTKTDIKVEQDMAKVPEEAGRPAEATEAIPIVHWRKRLLENSSDDDPDEDSDDPIFALNRRVLVRPSGEVSMILLLPFGDHTKEYSCPGRALLLKSTKNSSKGSTGPSKTSNDTKRKADAKDSAKTTPPPSKRLRPSVIRSEENPIDLFA